MELEVASPSIVTETQPKTNAEYLLFLLDNKVNSINTLTNAEGEEVTQEEKDGRLKRLLKPLTFRPNVGVGKYDVIPKTGKKLFRWISSFDDLKELINSVTNIRRVLPKNDKGISVWYADLPDTYCARCPYIRFRHLPEWAKYRATVSLVILDKRRENNAAPRHIAEEVNSFCSDSPLENLPVEEVKKIYHKVAFRINEDTLTFESYQPGIDCFADRLQTTKEAYNRGEENNDLDTVVLVGGHFYKGSYNPKQNIDNQAAPLQTKNTNTFFKGVVVNGKE